MIPNSHLPSPLKRRPKKNVGLIEDRIQHLVSNITGIPTNSLERFSINFLELHIGFSSLEDCEQILLEQTSSLYHDYETEKEKKRTTQTEKQKRLKQLTDLQIELRETEKHFKYYLSTKEELRHERQLLRRRKNDIEEKSEVNQQKVEEERDTTLQEIEKAKKKTETEIEFLKNSHDRLSENQRKVEIKIDALRREIEEVKFQSKQLADHVQLNQNEPKRISMQTEVVSNFISNVEDQRKKKSTETIQIQDKIRDQNEKMTLLTSQVNRIELDTQRKNNSIMTYNREISKLEKQIDELVNERINIDGMIYKLKQMIGSEKTNYYLEMKKQKKKKKMLTDQDEEINRINRQIENIKNSLTRIFEKRDHLLDKKKKLALGYQTTKLEIDDLKLQVDIKLNQLIRKDETNHSLLNSVRKKGNELKLYEQQLIEYINQEKEQRNIIFKLKQERERYTRALSNAKQRFILLNGEIKMHIFVNKELKKEYSSIHKERKESIKEYQLVKMSRNRDAKMIQDYSQVLSHIKRKKQILENEDEILQRKSLEKEKDIKKSGRVVENLMSLREEHKRKISKLEKDYKKLNDVIDEKDNEIRKLQKCIEEDGENLSQLKSQFEQKIEERNYNGIQLMDRNDELCILHEKLDFQKNVLKKGEFQIQKKDEQIKMFTIQLQSMLRELIIYNEKLPLIQSFITEKEKLLEEIKNQSNINHKLSSYIEDYNANKRRFRDVKSCMYTSTDDDIFQDFVGMKKGGSAEQQTQKDSNKNNPTSKLRQVKKNKKSTQERGRERKDLSSLMEQGYPKIDEIKEELSKTFRKVYRKKERYLEKQLILKELENTTDKMRKLCMESRDYYLDLSMTLNKFKKDTENKNRELKALMSELSIFQAKKMELQITNKQLKKNIVKFENRLNKNLPPSKEMFQMWEKEEILKKRRQKYYRDYLCKREMVKKHAQFATITRTKAQKRPNAYVPDAEGVIALPKPYMMKPFCPRPTQHGAIRHIKKPNQRKVQV